MNEMKLEFGIFDHLERLDIPLEQLYAERLDLIAAAETAGFFCYHLAEHHATPLGCAPSPSVFLAAVAARTHRIHFGPLVYLLPLYEPMRLAEEICMLDQLSGGRLEVGVGRGVSPFELAYFNVNFLESRAMFDEALQILVAALRNRKVSFQGKYYRYADAPLELAPKQKPNPPLWYGASTPSAIAYSARHGMNVVTGGPNAILKASFDAYRSMREASRNSDGDLNPQVEAPKFGGIRHCFVAKTDAEALEIARPAYRQYYANIVKLWRDFGTVPTIFTDDVDRAIHGDAAIVGSPATVREKVAAYAEQSGCNYLVLSFAWGSLTHEQYRHSLDLFASEVLPHFVES